MSSGVTPVNPHRTRDDQLSRKVVEAVADAEGVDPTELEVPLYAAVDSDALDALFREDGNAIARVQFTYYGYRITVEGDGELDLEEL